MPDNFNDEVISEVEQKPEEQPQNNLSTNLQNAMWGDAPQQSQEPQVENKPTTEVKTEVADEEEIIDVAEWLKREFDVDDPNVLRTDREELKKLRDQKPKDFEFKNEDSRKYFDYVKDGKEEDLYNFLDRKKKIEKLSKADVTNKQFASELVKFGIKHENENANLSDDEIDFLYNERYAAPPKPVQLADELEEEYKERLDQWQSQVSNIEKRMTIDAKMAQPKLSQLITELILPDIQKSDVKKQPTQEELDKFAKSIEDFVQISEKSVNDFKGFSTKVKDKDVEIPVNYELSKDEKKFVTEKMNAFAKSGFNTNEMFLDRWVNKEGDVNVAQMTEDLSRLYFGDKVSNKFATDAMGQRLETYLKQKKNININDVNQGRDFSPNDKTQSQRLQEQFWGS